MSEQDFNLDAEFSDTFTRIINEELIPSNKTISILVQSIVKLRTLSNISHIETTFNKSVLVIGDIHGNIRDLVHIIRTIGLPRANFTFIFNGDYVDRGLNSLESLLIILLLFLKYPKFVHINRGNHEDYATTSEIIKSHIIELYCSLPLCVIIDKEIFVCHGGISKETDLEILGNLDRFQFKSVLNPPTTSEENNQKNISNWQQILNLLWSDPVTDVGCRPNRIRGIGCYFGPDITEDFLNKLKLSLIIRSHECFRQGWSFTHSKKVLTIFSASNYNRQGSNLGAVLLIRKNMEEFELPLDPLSQLFQINPDSLTGTIKTTSASEVINLNGSFYNFTFLGYDIGISNDRAECLNRISLSLAQVKELLIKYKDELVNRFRQNDPSKLGIISFDEWSSCVKEVLIEVIPFWFEICSFLIVKFTKSPADRNKFVKYISTFDDLPTFYEAIESDHDLCVFLYKHSKELKTTFKMLDKTNTGLVKCTTYRSVCEMIEKRTLDLDINTENSDLISKRLITTLETSSSMCNLFISYENLIHACHIAKYKTKSKL